MAITLPPLSGSNWSLVRLNGKPILPETYISARFDDEGTVSGSAGCNRYRAPYEVDGSRLTVGAAVSTMMACLPPLMEQERAYLAAAAATVSYELSGDTLLLKEQGGTTVAQFTVEPQGLAGTTWDVTTYNNGKQAVVSLIAGTKITANFGAEGTLAGNASCNDYMSTYAVDGEAIAIGPPRTTRKLCRGPEGIMEQERLYLAALETVATYRIEGRTMEMRTAAGALAARFKRAGESPAAEEGSQSAATESSGQACITGAVNYSEPVVLPEDAVVRVRLSDTSRMDAPAIVVGEQAIPSPGSFPCPYQVCYDPGDIQENHTYSMQARVEDSSGHLLFINDTHLPVITRGHPTDDVEIPVIQVLR